LPLVAACALLGSAAPAFAVGGDPPTQAEVDKAVETVKKDPNLAAEKTERTIATDWSSSDEEKKKEPDGGRSPPHAGGRPLTHGRTALLEDRPTRRRAS